MPALVCNLMANTGHVPSGEIGSDRDSLDSNSSSNVDLESGGASAVKLHSGDKKKKRKKRTKKNNGGRDCRICHLDMEGNHGGFEGGDEEEEEEGGEEDEEEDDDDDNDELEEEHYGQPMQLGCSCKGDLGVAHRKCAETWFKMKGNMTCEICGATALNMAGEQGNPGNTASATIHAVAAPPLIHAESQSFWHGRRVMNFLLTAMVLAFIISWLFHFKVLN